MTAADELRWYLIHCKARQDERALENLQRQGFECFRPVRQVERLREGRRYTVIEALFPRYLFIHLDSLHDNWYPIRSTRGVNEIVRFNDYPVPAPNDIIEEIRARLAGPSKAEPYFKPGDRVHIAEGAFAQSEAIFLSSDGDERVVLLMNILHREHRVKFPLASVRKCG